MGISAAGMGVYLAASFWAYDELNTRLPTDRGFRASVAYPLTKMGAGALAGVLGQVCANSDTCALSIQPPTLHAGPAVLVAAAGDRGVEPTLRHQGHRVAMFTTYKRGKIRRALGPAM